jgi:DNA-directed RNA polymerase specialized sigma24 family protein
MGSLSALRTEEQLLAALLTGDVSAPEELYDRYAAALYGIALRGSASQATAERMLTATFERFWKRVHQYDRSKGRLFTYIVSIMRELVREEGLRGERLLLGFSLEERAMDLSQELSVVYLARSARGLSDEQAAIELGLSEEEVRHRWRSAVRQLVTFARRTPAPEVPVDQG